MGRGCQVGHKSSAEELQTPLVLQPMQCARHLETAATQLLGQAYHLDDHTLSAYGVSAVAMDKVDDAAVDVSPWLRQQRACRFWISAERRLK